MEHYIMPVFLWQIYTIKDIQTNLDDIRLHLEKKEEKTPKAAFITKSQNKT